MIYNSLKGKSVLITGGTSGLGKSLASKFLEAGSIVTVIGRNGDSKSIMKADFIFCDLASLDSVVEVADSITQQGKAFDIIVNNAGILSPPTYAETGDGFEISFQVNFLSHVLLTSLLLKRQAECPPLVINMSSPIYKNGKIEEDNIFGKNNYGQFQAYSNSKFFMALFSKKLVGEGVESFSFNPGTFSSGIYRSQKGWFQLIYKIAAPFMINSETVAGKLINIIANKKYSNGEMIAKNGATKSIDYVSEERSQEFWHKINSQLDRYNLA